MWQSPASMARAQEIERVLDGEDRGRSARRDLLGRLGRRGAVGLAAGVERLGYVEVADFGRQLHGGKACTSEAPVFGRELQESVVGPVRPDADEVTEIGLGIQLVETRGRDEGEVDGRRDGMGRRSR